MGAPLALRRSAAWLLAAWIGASSFGACVEEETRDRFDDDSFGGSTPTATVGGSGNTGAGNTGAGAGTPTGAPTGTPTGTPPPCDDPGPEPNDSEAAAFYLGSINSTDGSGGVLHGVLAGNEIDWYWYEGVDVWNGVVDPSRSVDAQDTVRMCAFYDCVGLVLECPDGTTAESSPQGLPGCCSTAGFTSDIDCEGSSDDAVVYIRLDKPPAFPCVPYTLTYHY